MTDQIRSINLHPSSNYLPSTISRTTYGVIVIGSGPAAHSLTPRTAASNLPSLMIEDELIGGDCPFWACTPSKALLRPGDALEGTRQLSGAKELISNEKVIEEKAVFARRDKFTNNWDDSNYANDYRSQGVDLVRGKGVLIGEKRVKITHVSGESIELQAEHAVVIATGSSPIIPDIPGLRDINFWTPREATSSNYVPEHLLILGGGVVGCEMATFYGSFDKKVTLITSASSLLPRFELEAGKRVKTSLEAKGVTVLLSTTAKSIRKLTSTTFEATLTNGSTLSATTLLIAAGRKPNLANIGLEQFGIDTTRALSVDDSLCINSPAELQRSRWLYAVGDANSLAPMTHMAAYQARPAANSIIAQANGKSVTLPPSSSKGEYSDFTAPTSHTPPQVVVTDPQVASAGLTLAAAQARGLNVKAVTVTPYAFPGAWLHAEFNYDGWAQWVIDVDRAVLVGATFVGRDAGVLLHASTVAIVGEVPIKGLWHAVASFPTLMEVYTELLGASGY